MEGANLSGDLKEPRKTIGKGTLIAVFASFLTYISLVITQAGVFDRDTLRVNMNVLQETAAFPPGVIVGILIATSSSALGAMFGGSRVLQALARDDLFPGLRWLGKGSFGADEPRRAVLFTWFIAQICLFIGDLDIVAPVISSFFCLSYAITNFSALLLRLSGTPNFRPTFKYFNGWIAFFGGLLNIGIMFWLNVWYAIIAIACLVLIYAYLSYRNPRVSWGDVSQALMFHQVRKYLLRLDERKSHGKLWRPSVLLYMDTLNGPLANFCNRMKKGGLFILGTVMVGDYDQLHENAANLRSELLDYIEESDLKAFPQISIASSSRIGYQNLLLMSGLGALSPNTVVIPMWTTRASNSPSLSASLQANKVFNSLEEKSPERSQRLEMMEFNRIENLDLEKNYFESTMSTQIEYVKILQDVLKAEKNLVIAANFTSGSFTDAAVGTIDVWITDCLSTRSWVDFKEKALILLQLAHVIQVHRDSSSFDIRIYFVTSESDALEKKRMEILAAEARIEVSDVIVIRSVEFPENERAAYIKWLNHQIVMHSSLADLVFAQLPYSPTSSNLNEEDCLRYCDELKVISQNLPWTLLIQNGEPLCNDIMSRDI
jgi:potassium/chloride transporter 9